ncbi:hypothetical protein GX408_08495, partial [bacterium]|nr:hypothetical protein [bacterium]
ICRRRLPQLPGWDPYYLNIDWVEGFEHLRVDDPRLADEFSGNTFRSAPFMTFDPSTKKLTITDPTLLPPGFQPPPLEKMGLQRRIEK